MKKRNTMSIAIIAALLTALAVLTSFCAIGGIGNETNDEDDIKVEETSTTENGGAETEDSDITENIGGEETANGQKSATRKEIEEMKEHMIRLLNENYDVFNRIVAYFEGEPEIIAVGRADGELVGHYKEAPGLIQKIELCEVGVGEEIAYVIDELGFLEIYDGGEYVLFYMVYMGWRIVSGPYSQSLVCNKSTAGEYALPKDLEASNSLFGLIHIRDEWFYEGVEYGH